MEHFAIGRSRNGKIISSHPNLDDLNADDEVFDAMAVLSRVAIREYRRDKFSEAAKHLREESDKLKRRLIDKQQLEVQMDIIGAKTSIDIARYALRLLRPEFKD